MTSEEVDVKKLRWDKQVAKTLYLITPCAFHQYFVRVGQNFGWKFVGLLLSCYVPLKGCLHTFVTRVELPYYRSLGLDGIAYQSAAAVSTAPWAMKGAIGALSDGMPIMGYYKRPYMVMTALLGTLAFIALAVTPHSVAKLIAWLPPVLFFFGNLELSTIDLLCEGKYAELMAERPKNGFDIVTFVWMAIMLGKIFGSALVGPLSDHVGTYVVFIISAPLAAQILVPTLLGWLPEQRKEPWKFISIESSKIAKERKLFALSVLMAGGALGFVVVALVTDPLVQFIYAAVCSFILCILSFFCMSRMMALCNLYMFLQDILHPTILGALDFWYTAPQSCVPGGPSFSYTYYSTWSGLVGIMAGFVGLFFFQVIVSKWTFRRAFWVTTIVRLAASLFDFIIILRWNISIGIPDHVMYLFGDAIIQDTVTMLNFMPSVVLISKLCPKGVESTVYAILAGFANFGGVVSKSVGVYAIKAANIETTEPCNFDGLPWLIITCHIILPLITVPLTFCLLPSASMSDVLLPEASAERGDTPEIQNGEDKFEGDDESPPMEGGVNRPIMLRGISRTSTHMNSGYLSNSSSSQDLGGVRTADSAEELSADGLPTITPDDQSKTTIHTRDSV